MSKHEAFKNHIEALRKRHPGSEGILLASNEGLAIAHPISNGSDPNRVAAMATAASSHGRRINDTMSVGALGKMAICGEEGWLLIYSAGSKAMMG